MSTQPLSLSEVDLDSEDARDRPRWTRENPSSDSKYLVEDTRLPERAAFRAERRDPPSPEDTSPDDQKHFSMIRFATTDIEVDRPRLLFGDAVEELLLIRTEPGDVDQFASAMVLKRDVKRLRQTNYSRHASILLAVADAFTFTASDEVTPEAAGSLAGHALGLLSEPFIPEDDEAEFLGAVLSAGWNLAPSAG